MFKKEERKIHNSIACFTLILITICLISCFPPTGDDWVILGRPSTQIQDFIEISVRDWNNQNGRVLGNLFFNLGIHGRFFAKVISLFLLLYLLLKITKIKKVPGVIFSLAILFFTPISIFREVWVWTAGFYNYVISAVLLLLLIYFIQTSVAKKQNGLNFFLIFITSLATCLFLENITLYLFSLSFIALLSLFIWRKQVWPRVGLIAGAWAGTLLMFSSPSYRRVAENTDGYREVRRSIGEILQTVRINLHDAFFPNLIKNHLFLLFLFFILSVLLIWMSKKEKKYKIVLTAGITLGTVGLWLVPMQQVKGQLFIHFFYYLMLFLVFCLMTNGKERALGVFSFLSIVIVLAPLLIVFPVGARNFFTPQIFHAIILLIMAQQLERVNPKWIQFLTTCLYLLLMIRGFYDLHVYLENYSIHKERVHLVERALDDGEKNVYVPAFPYPDYVHAPDPSKMGYVFFYTEKLDLSIRQEN